MRQYTETEIQELREIYEADEEEFGCGYWSVCAEHDCFCSSDAPTQQGFNIEVWDRMAESYRETMTSYREEMREIDEEMDEMLAGGDDGWGHELDDEDDRY